jgi:antitoxin (DNA-binding transcriptional repressor) of toxin-antitoxin stability system
MICDIMRLSQCDCQAYGGSCTCSAIQLRREREHPRALCARAVPKWACSWHRGRGRASRSVLRVEGIHCGSRARRLSFIVDVAWPTGLYPTSIPGLPCTRSGSTGSTGSACVRRSVCARVAGGKLLWRGAAASRRTPAAGLVHVTTGDYIHGMKVVGIRELKARLSEYLRDVRRGEVILVTDRHRVVAELRPPGMSPPPVADDVAQRLDQLAASGDAVPPRLRKDDWSWRPPGLGLRAGTADRLVDSLREERGA